MVSSQSRKYTYCINCGVQTCVYDSGCDIMAPEQNVMTPEDNVSLTLRGPMTLRDQWSDEAMR